MPGTAATGGMRKEPQPVLINGASFEATGRARSLVSLGSAIGLIGYRTFQRGACSLAALPPSLLLPHF